MAADKTGQEQVEGNFDESHDKSAENQDQEPDATGTADDSPASDEEEHRARALEEQLARARAESEALRESLRLQAELLKQQLPKEKKELSPELAELGKAINPLLKDEIQETVQPVISTVSKLYDQTDAVNFQLELQRENPELFKPENFDRVMQAVEAVRRRAATESGTWISRSDAYKYAKGAGLLKLAPKKSSQSADSEEAKRQKSVRAAQAAGRGSDMQRGGNANAEISRIREKAQRGEQLTPEERAKYRSFLENVSF